jgi:hypothetical protein
VLATRKALSQLALRPPCQLHILAGLRQARTLQPVAPGVTQQTPVPVGLCPVHCSAAQPQACLGTSILANHPPARGLPLPSPPSQDTLTFEQESAFPGVTLQFDQEPAESPSEGCIRISMRAQSAASVGAMVQLAAALLKGSLRRVPRVLVANVSACEAVVLQLCRHRCIAKLALRCAKLQLRLQQLGMSADVGRQLLQMVGDTHAELLLPHLTRADSTRLMQLMEEAQEEESGQQ